MCGICGQYNFGSQSPVARHDIESMTRSLAHRGPDDEGYHVAGSLGLGFRRLSIIDLEGGHQPMSDQEKTVWVVFNGEIYNFLELRRELESHGHVFRTRSDTEVIIHGFKQWGDQVLNRLNGMFGLAIWDERRKRLLIARDAMGMKLVYYKIEGASVYFGSEIRSILAGTGEKPAIDVIALNLFLRYRYTPSPLTVYKGIKKLAPGTALIIENGTWRSERWYKYKPIPFAPDKSDGEAKDELLELYKKAIKRHLISDVPLGLLLSGGVDSGLLLGLMQLSGDSWRTYTVGYGATYKDDELSDAAKIAELYSAKHASVELSRSTFEATLAKIVSILEEPVASSSIVPMYLVCERARRDVKVVLMGQGPDELFGGYRRHLGVHYGSYWRKLPKWARFPLVNTINALPRNDTLKRGVNSLGIDDRLKRYQSVLSILPGDTIDELFLDGLVPRDAGDTIQDCWADLESLMENTDELGGLQFLELRSSLPDELLMYADKLSMAHGLEVRVPYLDKEIVEYVERLSAHFKVRHGSQKWLHRQVSQSYLPAWVLKRPKRGFAVNVVDDWFRDATSSKMPEILLDKDSRIYRYLHQPAVQELLNQHSSGRQDNHKILFSIIIFEEWLRCYG